MHTTPHSLLDKYIPVVNLLPIMNYLFAAVLPSSDRIIEQ